MWKRGAGTCPCAQMVLWFCGWLLFAPITYAWCHVRLPTLVLFAAVELLENEYGLSFRVIKVGFRLQLVT